MNNRRAPDPQTRFNRTRVLEALIVAALLIALAVLTATQAHAADVPRTIDARAIPQHPIKWSCYFSETHVTNSAGSAWIEKITPGTETSKTECAGSEAEAGDTLARWHFACSAFVYIMMDTAYGMHMRCRVPGGIADYFTSPNLPVMEVR